MNKGLCWIILIALGILSFNWILQVFTFVVIGSSGQPLELLGRLVGYIVSGALLFLGFRYCIGDLKKNKSKKYK